MPRLDKMDDSMIRCAQIIMQIMAKKNELNANLDKERKRGAKEGIFQNFSHTVVFIYYLFLKKNLFCILDNDDFDFFRFNA